MKKLDDAVGLRSQILRAFETAATTHDAAAKKAWMTFVVVGAGPTGVELAGQLAALSRRTLAEQFGELDPADARILLADAGQTVLSPFDPSLQGHAHHQLAQLGIEVRLGEEASDIDDQGIVLRRTRKSKDQDLQVADSIRARTVIWAAGVRPVPLTDVVAAAADVKLDGKGRLKVRADCSLPGHPDIFAIGDMVDLDDLPGLAEPAMQEGRYVATSSPAGSPAPLPRARSATSTSEPWPRALQPSEGFLCLERCVSYVLMEHTVSPTEEAACDLLKCEGGAGRDLSQRPKVPVIQRRRRRLEFSASGP